MVRSETRQLIRRPGDTIEYMNALDDFERCYRAVDSRDTRFDGWFFIAVSTTKIYCRPSCPAQTPRRENVRFYPSAAAAQRAGYRACLRCRPDAAPGSPEWDVRADVAARAMRLIADGAVDRDGVGGLASRLGYTERHLNRLLTAEVGAGPLALARAQRAQTARVLVETTDLGLAEIAFAAGFGSVRQFNDTIREIFGRTPSQLRQRRRSQPAAADGWTTVPLRLAYRRPLAAGELLDFLAARALPGVEEVTGGAYRRALRLPHGPGVVTLAPADGYVAATLRLADLRDLSPAVSRCRRLLDLSADPQAVDAVLGADPALAADVAALPGVRLPRSVDGFEMLCRAIVGQQVSVAAARRVLGNLAAALGEPVPADGGLGGPDGVAAGPRRPQDDAAGVVGTPADNTAAPASTPSGPLTHTFPDAAAVADAPDELLPMPAARRRALRTAAGAVADGKIDLAGGDPAEVAAALLVVPGVGPWTVDYVSLRGFGEPDTFLAGDLGVRRGAAALGMPDAPRALAERAEAFRPWRSYAVIRLWRHAALAAGKASGG
jgi:AraC family transcriptional regulator, regulatory protein of adaptative response / DNA-3-methyladenine glycosylase II